VKLLFPLLLLAATVSCLAAPPERANIVFILADDYGPESVGVYGSELYSGSTPEMDALAAAGLKFTRVYCTGICTPSRMQYVTGQYPFRNGSLDIDGTRWNDPNRPELPDFLQQAGYRTGGAGKGGGSEFHDEYLSGGTGWYWEERTYTLKEPPSTSAIDVVKPAGIYFPDVVHQFALDFIARNAGGSAPFYFYYSLIAPHPPYRPTPDHPSETDEATIYRHSIEYMDKQIGEIIDQLDAYGVLDNTLVIVTGDNGSNSKYRGKMWDPNSGTYRSIHGAKADRTQNREGTALVPMIVHWPEVLGTPGGTRDELIDFTDMLPTFCDVAAFTVPDRFFIDGHSFAPLMRGDPTYEPRAWVYHQLQNNWCLRGPDYRLNRDGRFFDMADAPFSMSEITSLTPEQETIRATYQAVLDEFDPVNGPTYEGHQDAKFNATVWAWKETHWNWKDKWDKFYSGDAADPDGDGVWNIFERAFGWDPNNGTDVMPEVIYSGGSLEIQFPAALGGSDCDVYAEVSGDLTGWGSSASDVQTTGSTMLESRDIGAAPGATRRFMRLSADRVTVWEEP